MLAANKGSLEEYLGNTPQRTITRAALPLVLIPTTAGTGSEVTKVGVYTSAAGRKYTLGSPLMMAKSAILSGSILGSIPPKLCAATGFDALDHALESIWNKNATEHTREIAEAAAVEVLTWLPKAYENAVKFKGDMAAGKVPNPQELASFSRNMLRASCMAGTAFSVTGTAAGHALSFVLSEDWHVPHGMACAFTLLDIFDLAAGEEAVEISLERISQKLFPAGTEKADGGRKGKIKILRDRIASLVERMEIPKTFKDLGVSIAPQDIDAHFGRSFTDPKMLNQLPVATKENIYPLLERKC
jgi:alcohol dehydrogenase class IV